MVREIVSEADVIGYYTSLSNWGRWGTEDELGTLNLITPEKRKQAAALVKSGIVVSLAPETMPVKIGPTVPGPPFVGPPKGSSTMAVTMKWCGSG